jgi:hypothetical protein
MDSAIMVIDRSVLIAHSAVQYYITFELSSKCTYCNHCIANQQLFLFTDKNNYEVTLPKHKIAVIDQ